MNGSAEGARFITAAFDSTARRHPPDSDAVPDRYRQLTVLTIEELDARLADLGLSIEDRDAELIRVRKALDERLERGGW